MVTFKSKIQMSLVKMRLRTASTRFTTLFFSVQHLYNKNKHKSPSTKLIRESIKCIVETLLLSFRCDIY